MVKGDDPIQFALFPGLLTNSIVGVAQAIYLSRYLRAPWSYIWAFCTAMAGFVGWWLAGICAIFSGAIVASQLLPSLLYTYRWMQVFFVIAVSVIGLVMGMKTSRYYSRLKTLISHYWEDRIVRFSILIGFGIGGALGLFLVTVDFVDSPFLSGIFYFLAWLFAELPVEAISFLFCRPDYQLGCAGVFHYLYLFGIGMPLVLLSWILLFGICGSILGSLIRLIVSKLIFKR